MKPVMTVASFDVVRAVRAAFNGANNAQALPLLSEQEILNHLLKRNVITISMIKKPDIVMVADIAGTVRLPAKSVRQLRQIGLEFLTDLETVTETYLMEQKFVDAALIGKLQEGLELFDMGLKGPAPAE